MNKHIKALQINLEYEDNTRHSKADDYSTLVSVRNLRYALEMLARAKELISNAPSTPNQDLHQWLSDYNYEEPKHKTPSEMYWEEKQARIDKERAEGKIFLLEDY